MAINASQSQTQIGNYNEAQFKSVYALLFPPEIWNEWYEKYADGFKVLDFLNMAGRTSIIRNREYSHFEDGTDLRVATTRTQIGVGAAGAVITFQLLATDYDGFGQGPLREDFSVYIPAANQPAAIDVPRQYVITGIAGAGAAQTYTATPLSADSQIAVAVVASTELMIGSSVYAPGMRQPAGMTTGTFERDHTTQISKESCGFEGGAVAHRTYREVVDMAGQPGIFDRGMVETEFRLDRQIDNALFLGEQNANGLTQNSNFGGTPNRQGTKGLWNWMAELAQTKNYIGDFDMDDFDDIKPLLQSQGVNGAKVFFGYGSNLGLDVENGILDGVKEYSGGSDLLPNNKFFEVDFRRAKKNGVDFTFQELISFSNPNTFGNDSYDFSDSGMMFPITDVSVTVEGKKMTVPNLSVAYLNHNGEDRTRIMGTVAGLNGLGYSFSNDIDGLLFYLLSEYSLFAANVNQFIRILKT